MNRKQDKQPMIAIQNTARPAQNVVSLKASHQVADRVTSMEMARLNANELKSIRTLLAFVAEEQQVRQETVQSIVENRFGVDRVQNLQPKDYQQVVQFLIELNVELLTN